MFVCTLPSPACMCRATHTRPRSTRLWISSTSAKDRRESSADEQAAEVRAHFSLPRRAHRAVLHEIEHGGCGSRSSRRSKSARNGSKPTARSRGDASRSGASRFSSRYCQRALVAASDLLRLRLAIAKQLLRVKLSSSEIVDLAELQLAVEVRLELREQLQLVLERELDVDALDRVGVVAHAIERDHDVFVDLERVRVPRDRGRARAIEPEFLARIGIDGDEAFAGAAVRYAHDFGRRAPDRRFVVADDVAEQHHLRQRAALRFRRIADRAQIALVEVLEARELHASRARLVVEECLDLDDRWNRVTRVTEELEAHRADVLRHAMQNPARGRDHAVAAFLLHARQAAEELVRDVLAEPGLAKLAALRCRCASVRSTRARSARSRPSFHTHSNLATSTSWILPRLCPRRVTSSQLPSGSTMRHQARLSTAVPHSTAFLPPAFIATLPPMHEASAEVGSTANT